MKPLQKDELYENLQGFLKTKGVELKEGSYVQKIQKSCGLLAEAINAGQKGLTRAKGEIDRKLEQLRQVIHEKTAPAGQAAPPPQPKPRQAEPRAEQSSAPQTGKKKSARRRKGR